VVEEGATAAVFDTPQSDYTRTLIAAALDTGAFGNRAPPTFPV
jgi:ABC-type microcin C transport system duplicated ATPase subunit YejF